MQHTAALVVDTKRFVFNTSCIHSTADWINEMTDSAVEITRQTFLRHVPRSEIASVFEGYGFERGYVPKEGDGFVSYHKSLYRGSRCYYFCWSAIEFIFSVVGETLEVD